MLKRIIEFFTDIEEVPESYLETTNIVSFIESIIKIKPIDILVNYKIVIIFNIYILTNYIDLSS